MSTSLEKRIKIITDQLYKAKDQYYNGDGTYSKENPSDEMIDAAFDKLENELRELDPNNPYFFQVGADIRGEKTALPYPMGSLDQLQLGGDVEKWIRSNSLQTHPLCISEKIDGASATIMVRNGKIVGGFSRGNGIEGADISRHIKKIKSLPQIYKSNISFDFRAEIVLPRSIEQQVRQNIFDQHGKQYKNARNFVSGQLNSEEAYDEFYQNVHIVGYSLFNPDDKDSRDQLEFLKSQGILIPRYALLTNPTETQLIQQLNEFLQSMIYEIDGIVITIDSKNQQDHITATNPPTDLNPRFSKKFKITQENNIVETQVVDVEWNPSPDGYLIPRVQIKPVDLQGVTITYTTGFNAKYIVDKQIGPGTVIQITRSGDVIPYIVDVLKSTGAILPDVSLDYTWDNNQVHLILKDPLSHDIVKVKQLQGFFTKINTPGLKDANVEKFFHRGFQTIESILFADKTIFVELLGPNAGETAYSNLHTKLQSIEMPLLAAASNCYGRGIGERKLQQLVDQHGDFLNLTFEQIKNSHGFDDITAKEVVAGNQKFSMWFEGIKHLIKLAEVKKPTSDIFKGQYYVFTGVRDENLKKQLIDNGAEVGDSKSRMTSLVCANPQANSAKIKAAQQRGCEILSLEQAWQRVKEISK